VAALVMGINKGNHGGLLLHRFGFHMKKIWRRKKSHLLRSSDFSDSQHTACMLSILKKQYTLYMELFGIILIGFLKIMPGVPPHPMTVEHVKLSDFLERYW